MINQCEFILYVSDQEKSCDFYKKVLLLEPVLNVEGMTEFDLAGGTKLGLMPEKGIAKILGSKMPEPSTGNGIPRCELYLYVNDPNAYIKRSIEAGAVEVSPLESRAWGDIAGYLADPDGHVIAFAQKL
ncbi:MAG TPA: VOC family protein [Ignavibacteria bacterium]|nr:VOC family protein [Ignavibacteria bacterium]